MSFNNKLLFVIFAFFLLLLNFSSLQARNILMLKAGFLPGGNALEEIMTELKRAKKSIDISMFYLSHDEVIKALCYKASKGLEINIYLDAVMNSQNYKDEMRELIRAGCRVFIENLPKGGKLHVKYAVIDEQTVITGTANWTSYGLGSTNVEDVLIIKDKQIATQYLQGIATVKKVSKPYDYEYIAIFKKDCRFIYIFNNY